ncbi:adenylate/guanylate cyclase domain-containing protein [Gammaproteobacteria bacterium]|nr:adenylate/guanylate cyclase domain-containing protein [Gammaproteobacteria bacterium]
MRVAPLLRKKVISLVLVVAATLLVTLLLQSWGVFSRIELASFDHRVGLFRSDREINENVVVVLIDEASLQELNQDYGRWPWPRSAYAELLEFFTFAGAQGVAFDILFSEQQDGELSDGNDQQLVAATLEAGNVVHAMQLLHSEQSSQPPGLPEEFRHLFGLKTEHFVGSEYNNALLPFEFLYLVSQGVGFVEIAPDRDGIYRRIRLFNRHEDGTVLPSLASALLLPLFGIGNTISSGLQEAQFGAGQVPLDGQGNYLINPYGQVETVSMAQVIRSIRQLKADNTENLELDPARFNGKLILLGASAIGLLDVKATALAATEAGVFLHAYTVSNMLDQDFLTPLDGITEIALLLLVCCIGVLPLMVSMRFHIAAALSLLVGAIYLTGTYAAFPFNLVMPLTPVIFALLVSLALALMIHSYRQSLAVSEITRTIAVPPASKPERLHSGLDKIAASRESLTVLCVNLHDVSNSWDTLEARQVVESLNLCFAELATVIAVRGGTLDRISGESIQAYWGPAGKTSEHPGLALECANAMVSQLKSINEKLTAHQYPQVDLSIGIHSGKAVLGTVGAPTKRGYSIIGADVDLTRQLQALCAQYGCPILFSESTCNDAPSSLSWLQVDRLKINGKRNSTNIYTLTEAFRETNNLDMSSSSLQQALALGFDLFQQESWHAAAESYGLVGQCVLSNLFRERCKRRLANKPEPE